MFCPRCARENDDGARFCRRCGLSLRLIPEALEGMRTEDSASGRWKAAWIGGIALLLCAGCASLGYFYDASEFSVPTGIRLFGSYLTGASMFATAAAMAYFMLHPSVQIGYRERIKEMAFGVALLLGAGGVAIGLQTVQLPMLGLALAILMLVVAVPTIVMAGRAVAGAQRRATEEAEEAEEAEEEETHEAESITDRIDARREAWQLEPPPSVVSTALDDAPDVVVPEDAVDTARLPPNRVRD
jgi:hypothetical protein